MTQPSSTSLGVEDVYRSVISDVISNLRETFLDENVDVDILQQLKKEWEDKVNKSGAVNFDGNKTIAPPPIRHQQHKPQAPQATPTPITTSTFTIASTSNPALQLPQSIHTTAHLPSSSSAFVVQQQQLSNSMGILQQQPMLIQAQQAQQLMRPSQPATYYLSQQHQFLPQQTILLGSQSATNPQHITHQQLFFATPGGQPQPVLPIDPKGKKEISQLDGGPGMTDSSSEEEDEEEDDGIKQYIGLQDEHAADGEGAEEDPLNSNDDQSDEEDLETLFDSENVVVCQFEKVNRARSKWKFILKDGIMHLNGKDYCFQKCTGEAEW
ncbi:hypothetical protein M3Y98_00125300 [Aphelenchoides besseyi]|nr:hypothetical protein M3Y98_00125300 [Aphelenchoides besseyi]